MYTKHEDKELVGQVVDMSEGGVHMVGYAAFEFNASNQMMDPVVCKIYEQATADGMKLMGGIAGGLLVGCSLENASERQAIFNKINDLVSQFCLDLKEIIVKHGLSSIRDLLS